MAQKRQPKRQARRGARSSETGRFITDAQAKRNPSTTQHENIPLPGYGDTGRSKKKPK